MNNKIIILICLLITANNVYGVTVEGYAFLKGKNNSEGIKVIFKKNESTKGEIISCLTDSTGYYNVETSKGAFDISYIYKGRQTEFKEDVIIINNTKLEEVRLNTIKSKLISFTIFFILSASFIIAVIPYL